MNPYLKSYPRKDIKQGNILHVEGPRGSYYITFMILKLPTESTFNYIKFCKVLILDSTHRRFNKMDIDDVSDCSYMILQGKVLC